MQDGGVLSRPNTSVFHSSVCYRAPELLELSHLVQIILNVFCLKTNICKHKVSPISSVRWQKKKSGSLNSFEYARKKTPLKGRWSISYTYML